MQVLLMRMRESRYRRRGVKGSSTPLMHTNSTLAVFRHLRLLWFGASVLRPLGLVSHTNQHGAIHAGVQGVLPPISIGMNFFYPVFGIQRAGAVGFLLKSTYVVQEAGRERTKVTACLLRLITTPSGNEVILSAEGLPKGF